MHWLHYFGVLACLWPSVAQALSVKVTSVDYRSECVTVLLPVHHTQIELSLDESEPEIQVREGEFYSAEVRPGKVSTTERNLLVIEVEGRKVRFRIRKIVFL